MKTFQDDVHQMVVSKSGMTHKELKKGVVRLCRKWVLDEGVDNDSYHYGSAAGAADVYQVYNLQRK